MATESFQLIYEGSDVRNGTMDVYELAPALTALGDLIYDANRFLNGDRATVNIRVDSDFKKGSFGIHLLLEQQTMEAVHQAFAFASLIEPAGLLDSLLGFAKEQGKDVVGILGGLFAIYKHFKGEKPSPGAITFHDNHGTIYFDNKQLQVDSRSAEMYKNDSIRADLDHVARSVAKVGIDNLELAKDGKPLNRITKEDLPSRVLALEGQHEETDHVLTDTREALIQVVTANFDKGNWKFSDGASKFNARINDPVFQQKPDDRQEGFYKGDILRVVIRTAQTEKPNGKIQTQYTIQEVIEHRRAGSQQRLLPSESK